MSAGEALASALLREALQESELSEFLSRRRIQLVRAGMEASQARGLSYYGLSEEEYEEYDEACERHTRERCEEACRCDGGESDDGF